jgi:cytochrome c oxidase subunit III
MSEAMQNAMPSSLPMLRVLDAPVTVDERLLGQGPMPPVAPDDSVHKLEDPDSAPLRTGIWIGLAAIFTMFGAFTSAAVVREGSADDWEHIALPSILYLNTAVLLVSSVVLEIARRRVRAADTVSAPAFRWTASTLALGFAFLVGQVVGWMQLRARDVKLVTGPSDAFFYVLTVLHACHVLGGLCGITRVMLLMKSHTLRRSTFDAAACYWHFMGLLWLYLLLLLWLRF